MNSVSPRPLRGNSGSQRPRRLLSVFHLPTPISYLRIPRSVLLASLLLTATACSKPESVAPVAAHTHHAPHGGTAVVLGAELYHLELVLDSATGRLTAYVLDGEMEEFIRITQPSLELVVTIGPERRTLTLAAAANSATGETVGSTSQFETQADWLKITPTFDAFLTRIEIRGTPFTAIPFNFPKGNDRD